MTDDSYEVPPLSRASIRAATRRVWDCIEGAGYTGTAFPVLEFADVFWPKLQPTFRLIPVEAAELGTAHGLTWPDEEIILLREDVYEGAERGQGRDRMTLAHELGHYFLHGGIRFARRISGAERKSIPPFRQSEWQANCFGGELLVPAHKIHLCSTLFEVAPMFGVSQDAASVMWRVHREGR